MDMKSKEKYNGHHSFEDVFEKENDLDSKSDSDKVVGGHGSRRSIYSIQKQRRQEVQAAFKKIVEDRKKKTGSTLTVRRVSPIPEKYASGSSDVRHIKAEPVTISKEGAAQSVSSSQNAVLSAVVDSGYSTQKRVVNEPKIDPKPYVPNPIEDVARAQKPPSPPMGNQGSVEHKPGNPVIPPSPANDYFQINGYRYRILNQLGKGGSSEVYQVYDEERKQCLAIKQVDLKDTEESVVNAYRNEIGLLKRLQKYPNRVVRMFDYEYVKRDQQLYVVMEKGDTDLASLFKSRQQGKLSDQMIAFYWLEMLKAVQVIHHEGIVHSDLKPANFLLVAGNLKLIDFGIANAVPANKTSVTRDCQMGTLNYISPEAVECVDSGDSDPKLKVGVKSDVWSLGCILYNMVYGKTPFQDIRNPMSKISALLNRKHVISFPPVADRHVIDVMKRCLERDPKLRASIDELLGHPYLRTYEKCSSTSNFGGNLQVLADKISKATPKTAARLMKDALDQMKSDS